MFLGHLIMITLSLYFVNKKLKEFIQKLLVDWMSRDTYFETDISSISKHKIMKEFIKFPKKIIM